MSAPRDEARALRFMVDELAAQRPPELAWDAIEQRLLERIARSDTPRWVPAAARPSALRRVATFAVAAAVLALGIGLSGSSRPAVSVGHESHLRSTEGVQLASGVAGARGDRDYTALAVGDAIESGAEAVTFVQEDSVRWTLAPGSRVVVRAMGVHGVGHVVALERGSLRAEVTPRSPAEGLVEAFAVEAEGTRVAVHGTLFSVTRLPDAVLVDVEHGAVAIGPTGHVGVTTGHLLVGPARASFSLDGGRTSRLLPRVESQLVSSEVKSEAGSVVNAAANPAAAAAAGDARVGSTAPGQVVAALPAAIPRAQVVGMVEPQAGVGPGSPASVAVASPEPPQAEPAVEPVANEPSLMTEAAMHGALAACFAKAGPPGLVVHVNSTLKLRVRADGSIQAARFDPPLKPEFQACAGSLMARRLAGGARDLTIPFSF